MTTTAATGTTRSVHSVLGESVRMPVEIRSARACSAVFTVHTEPVRRKLGDVGLVPVVPFPGRALCALAFVQYVDGDLGPYHEFAVSFLCRELGRRRTTGAYIHWLPVNQRFTREAGRSIWGFPKELADIDLDVAGPAKSCAVRADGADVATLHINRGVPMPSGMSAVSIDAYTARDGILRRTPWHMRPAGCGCVPAGLPSSWVITRLPTNCVNWGCPRPR